MHILTSILNFDIHLCDTVASILIDKTMLIVRIEQNAEEAKGEE